MTKADALSLSLFDSLKHNTHVEVRDLTGNYLSGAKIHMLQVLLWSNKDLKNLHLPSVI